MCKNNFKVAVLGGAGGIGQPLSLLLMQNPLVTRLALYDIAPMTPGVAEDLSQMNSDTIVEGGFMGEKGLGNALCCANVVVIPAGKARSPNMSRQDLFHTNAQLIAEMVGACITFCPWAVVAIITNPVNSMVPVAFEIRKAYDSTCPEKVFGVTTLDMVRASTFVGREFGIDPSCVTVPVIGGHSGTTIVPLLSQCTPSLTFTEKQIVQLTSKIQNAGTEVVKAKAGAGSATLSMAYCAARFVNSLLRALSGEINIVEYAYVAANIKHHPSFFATPMMIGQQGDYKIMPYDEVTDYEQSLIEAAIPQLEKEIEQGVEFVSNCQLSNKD